MTNQTTSWIDQAVIYQIFIDRFAGYNEAADDAVPERCGGNLAGIIDRLDYLSDLGVDAIWLTPFFKSSDYHGYSTTDFYQVDESFGNLADAKKLARESHKRGIKIIIDFTANHVSALHPFFQEAFNDLSSEYRSWFYFYDDNHYLTFLDFTSLPKLNLNYRPCREHVIGAAEYWIRELDADGLRLDHAIGPKDDFWREFRDRIKAIKSDCTLIGEAVLTHSKPHYFKALGMAHVRWKNYIANLSSDPFAYTVKHYVGLFDGCLDFSFWRTVGKWAVDESQRSKLEHQLKRHFSKLPRHYYLPTFVSSHDSNRFMFVVGNDYDRFKEAIRWQFSIPQPRIIYYGDEVGMTHEHKVVINSGWAGDLPARAKMNWHPNAKQKELLMFYKKLIADTKKNIDK